MIKWLMHRKFAVNYNKNVFEESAPDRGKQMDTKNNLNTLLD